MNKIQSIVGKTILGETLTNEEQIALESWIEEDPSNLSVLERLKTFELSQLILKIEDEGLGHEMTNQFINTVKGIEAKRRRRTLKRIACSVSAAAIIAISWLFIDYNKDPVDSNNSIVLQKNTSEEINGIRLITGSKVVNLDEEANYLSNNQIVAKEKDTLNSKEEFQMNTLIVPRGRECNFILPDGSRVWINSDSKLVFPNKFSDTLRNVELIGEAYFEVTKNPKAPFIVKTKDLNTTVLGTQFLISCYENRNEISLIEGSISVNKTGSNNRIVLKPGRGVILRNNESNLEETVIDAEKIIKRKNGLVLYDEEKLLEITADLKRLYDIDFLFEDRELAVQTFYLEIKRQDDIQYIMQLLKYTKKIDYTIKDKTIIIKPYRL